MLRGKGFNQAFNMKGGIKAWDGATAWGPVELNLDIITGGESASEMVVIAYGMEEALGRFYAEAVRKAEHPGVLELLERLGSIEANHMRTLEALYREVAPAGAGEEALRKDVSYERIEGGFRVDAFLEENARAFTSPVDCLQLALMLEAQALDLYLRFTEKMSDETARGVLFKTAEEEKGHLAVIGRMLDRVLSEEGA